MILGAICARGGSKGVPRKNLRPLGGEPLIVHTIRCAMACPLLDRVVVSTDDPEIAAVAARYGAEVPFLRPAELARDVSPKWAVFRHLVEAFEPIASQSIDVVVDLDTGVPLRQPADIEACIRLLESLNAEVVTTAYEAERNPYFNMVELDSAGLAHISKSPLAPITRRQDAPKVYSLSPAVFAIRREALWRHEHWSQCRLGIHLMPRRRAIDIDSELDYEIIESFLGKIKQVIC